LKVNSTDILYFWILELILYKLLVYYSAI
jgi:hypothetical protein